ncbi:cell cycle control protein [Histomonas meleagridis]|uniref:cell cycle control protein n=1 Tax=Histomonas meleagridis TaxID=135588 RepID=UPI00355AA210|nr:cell cycle control protein [Histomonas meleagridis]KAH0797559.1 cell cycle control protein [Histomonas meleagridis]
MKVEGFANLPIIQQELKMCRLRSTPACTSSIFFLLSILYFCLFCVVGYTTYYNTNIEVRYDDVCNGSDTCIVNFTIPKDINQPLGLYYKLTNFKQARKEIATSFETRMLMGQYVSIDDVESCTFRKFVNDTKNIYNLYIPCGVLPYLVFNDTFYIIETNDFVEKKITLEVDRDIGFQEPDMRYNVSTHWLEDDDLFPGTQTNEHFISWMRVSAFSPFRKLYAKAESMKAGNYSMFIHNNYKGVFDGRKYFIISETGSFGTNGKGVLAVFLVTALVLMITAILLGFMAYNRMNPTSKFHPKHLREVLTNPEGR